MRSVFVVLLVIFRPLFAADANDLIGVWKLISWQVVVGKEPPRYEFGAHPKGFLIFTREGRSMVLTTSENRRGGMSDSDRAALHKSMLSYSGKYRVQANDLIIRVDLSWNEEWNGTEQRRTFRLESNRLFIESAPGPSILFPGKTDFRRIVWEREK